MMEGYTAFITGSKQGCSLSQRGTLPPPSRLLVANGTLKSGPGDEWSGPHVFSTPRKVCGSMRNPGRNVSPQCPVGSDWMDVLG